MMKKSSIVFVLLISFHFFAAAQSNNDLITTLRIGPFKLRTAKADVEKIVGKTIAITSKDYLDTAEINYGGISYRLIFNQDYDDDAKKPVAWKLYSVSSTTTTFKTKSLIGIGSTKAEILQAYDKFDITIYNDYDYKQKGNAKDKIQLISLMDIDAGTRITFTTDNRVVKVIEVTVDEGGE